MVDNTEALSRAELNRPETSQWEQREGVTQNAYINVLNVDIIHKLFT